MSAGPIRFPLAVSADGRHLVDQSGDPVLVLGDAAWSLIANTTLDEAEHYLRDRQRKGFNAIIVNLIERKFTANAPRNIAGVEPFTIPGDFRAPHEPYMAHAEAVLDLAQRLNFIVFLAPAYLGYRYPAHVTTDVPEGWYDEVLANGEAGCHAWGRYLGERFGRFDNIVWSIGGDRNPDAATEPLRALVRGLRESNVTGLFTALVSEEFSPLDLPGLDWVDLNLTYTYGIVHRKLHEDYRRRPPCPTILSESTYEGEYDASEVQIRRQAYWSIVCGGCGHCFGNRPMWLFDRGWQEALDSPGALAMARFGEFFRALSWEQLRPDLDNTILVAGLGEARGLDRVCTAATADRRLTVSYFPVPRRVTVDLDALPGRSVDVEWFDPATGKKSTGAPLDGRGTAQLLPPFADDAVLIMRSADSAADR